MALFIGGPYDGRDLPIDPGDEIVWLPAEEDLEAFLADTKLTANITWVNRYRLDTSVEPPVYRYLMKLGPIRVEGPRGNPRKPE